jgi:hypothetical protein
MKLFNAIIIAIVAITLFVGSATPAKAESLCNTNSQCVVVDFGLKPVRKHRSHGYVVPTTCDDGSTIYAHYDERGNFLGYSR